jgi:hypothetical protein
LRARDLVRRYRDMQAAKNAGEVTEK